MKLSEICLVSTWSERFNIKGQLSLLHVNDTIHVIEYKDPERSIAVDVDHVELRDDDSTARFTFPRGSNDRLIFKIDDIAEFSVLCKAKEDCQAVCDLKLRLNSMLRDSYYSGVYSNLDPDAKLVLCDEVERMKKESPGVFFSSLLNSNEVRIDTANHANAKPAKGGDASTVALSEVACVFCDASKLYNTDLEFLVHPHVPKNSSGKNIYMCSVCIENWKEFREIAEHEEQLILPGEVNEEICAICSDTPSTLVLCGDCQRSFCNTCLQRILTPKEQNELTNNPDADWMCVCCIAGFSQHPPLGRTAWKVVVACPGKRGQYYGTLVPYVKSAQLSNGSSGDAAKLKNALADGLAIDAAVAQSTPLLASLAGKKAASRSGSAQDFSQYAEDGEDDISEEASLPPRAISRKTNGYDDPHRGAVAGSSASTPKGGPGRVRGKAKASYAVEDVDFAVTLQAQNKSAYSSNNRGNRMQKRQQGQGQGKGSAGANKAGPVLDERYYFGQYVGYYSLLCEEIAQRAPAAGKGRGGGGAGAQVKRKRPQEEIPTDDVCFLCKDGGDLIECDWTCPAAKDGERCLKVYHTYCLDFDVSDEKWCCPRHFCDMCGSHTLKYICKYCPVSICANCPENLVAKYGHARYCVVNDPVAGNWRHQPTAPGLQSIVCQSCTEMLEAIDLAASSAATSSSASSASASAAAGSLVSAKGSAPLELVRSELRDEKRFPGKFSGEGKPGTSSIYLKEATGSTSDDRTSTTDVVVVAKGKPQAASRTNSSVVVTTSAVAARPAPVSRSRFRAPVAQEEKVHVEENEPAESTAHSEEREGQRGVSGLLVPLEACSAEVVAAQDIAQNEKQDDLVEPSVDTTEVSQIPKIELDVADEEIMKPPAPPRSHKRGASKNSSKSITAASSPPASPKSTTSAVSSQQSRPKVSTGKPKYSELVGLGITESNSPRADSFSPPKKRAASSLAQFNISMQLKGDAKPTESGKARSGSASPPHKRSATSTTSSTTSTKKASAPSKSGERAEDSSDEEGELVTIPQRVTRSREQDAQLSTRSGKKLLSGSDLLPGLE